MTLEELIDATFMGKRISCGSLTGVIESATLLSYSRWGQVRFEVLLRDGGAFLIGQDTEFTLTEVEEGE